MRDAPFKIGRYGTKWGAVRFFRCYILMGRGCITYYDAVICSDFRYPGERYRSETVPEPGISVVADTPEQSEDLLRNFDKAHNLVGEALERIMARSCGKEG